MYVLEQNKIHKISLSHIELLLFIFIYQFTCSFNFSGKQYKDEAFLELPKDWTEGLNIKKKVGHKA